MILIEKKQTNAGRCPQIAEKLHEGLLIPPIVGYSGKQWHQANHYQKGYGKHIGIELRIHKFSPETSNEIHGTFGRFPGIMNGGFFEINWKYCCRNNQIIYGVRPIVKGPGVDYFGIVFLEHDSKKAKMSGNGKKKNQAARS